MKRRILLSTYVLRISDRQQNEQLMDKFNSEKDFIDLFNEYCSYIRQNVNITTDSATGYKIKITMADISDYEYKIDKDQRIVYGYFKSGVSGDKYEVYNDEEEKKEIDVDPRKHTAYKTLFFYLYVPKSHKKAYLILQRRSKFGIKSKFSASIKRYFRQQGYKDLKITISNKLPKSVFDTIIRKGTLKRLDFVKEKIPKTWEDYFKNGRSNDFVPGKIVSSFRARYGLPEQWKDFLSKLVGQRKELQSSIEIEEIEENFSEISYELEHEGKSTTFYILNQHKTQPDVDVTKEVTYQENGEPTLESLKLQAKELIFNLLEIKPA